MEDRLPKKKRSRYLNPHLENPRRKLRDFALWMLGYYRDLPYEIVPEGFSFPLPALSLVEKDPWAMWMGHSSYLISISGKHILTDPIWSNRCSPLPFFGPKRRHPPPIVLEDLPKIDYVLISHDHYDHLDKETVLTLHKLHPEILWVVPTGVKKWFTNNGIKNVLELNWWEEREIDSTFRITATPCQHFSGRLSPNMNRTLWAGYVIEDFLLGKSLYFVGDTGYNPHDFKEIGKRFAKIDLSLIPIGAYSPRKFMAPVHVEPLDAVHIHKDVNSQLSLGMHWKTFCLSEEPMEQPPFDLYRSMKREKLDPHTFLAIEPGQKINW